MAKYQTKAKAQKSFSKNRADEHIIPANCVAVFPMLIVSGSTYITENGIMPQNLTYDKGSFLFWQEVFDGRSSIKIQWEDAVLLNKPEGKNYYLADTQVGKYFYGKPLSNGTEELEIGEDASFDEFITMKANQTVKLRFEFQKSNRIMFEDLAEDLRFVDNDLYKLYLIPELCEGKLMYISEYEEGYEDKSGLSYWCEITFKTLGSELQKSGKAVEQYPQWSAPGEFYVKPKIEYSVGEVREKRIIIDPAGLHPKPIKYLQVELQGPALTSSVYAMGRRQEKDPETGKWKIGPSKHLLGVRFVGVQPNPLNRTSTPTKNYDCFIDEEVIMASTKEAMASITEFSQPLEQMKNGGFISLGTKAQWKGSQPASGIHISNMPKDEEAQETTNSTPNRWDYYDPNWHPLANFNFGTQEAPRDYQDYNTNGCVYADETMRYDKNDTMIDIMNKNAFTFNQQPIIPLSMFSTRPLYLRNIPLIGSIANFFGIGDIHLWNFTTNRQTSDLIFFGDADLCGMCAQLQQGYATDEGFPFPWRGKKQKVVFPINFFGNNQVSYNKLGVNSMNSTFCIELTDLISLTEYDTTNVYDTVLLGQERYENGLPIFPGEAPGSSKGPLLVNGSMKAQEALNTGFIIDAVIVQTIFDGKIRLSCYTNDDNTYLSPAWSTTILSNANWQGGAMRDWTNMFILSNWTDRFCRQDDNFTWPLPPHKQSENEVILNVSEQATFNTGAYWCDAGRAEYVYYYLPTEEWGTSLGRYPGAWTETSNYWQRNKPSDSTYRIDYNLLGMPGVEDKESFLNYFGNIQVDMGQSHCSMFRYRNHGTHPTLHEHPTLGAEQLWKPIGSFVEGQDEYDFEIPIISMNDPSQNPWIPYEYDDNAAKKYYQIDWDTTVEGSRTLGITVKPIIHIKLNQNDIEINFTDKSTIWASLTEDLGKAGLIRTKIPPDDFRPYVGRIQYDIHLNQIKFIKRDTQPTFSNAIYGVNGTETH